MTKAKPPQSLAASPSGGSARLSNKAKSKLQSLFKAQGIDKPANSAQITSARPKNLWPAKQRDVGTNGGQQSKQVVPTVPVNTSYELKTNGVDAAKEKLNRNQRKKIAKQQRGNSEAPAKKDNGINLGSNQSEIPANRQSKGNAKAKKAGKKAAMDKSEDLTTHPQKNGKHVGKPLKPTKPIKEQLSAKITSSDAPIQLAKDVKRLASASKSKDVKRLANASKPAKAAVTSRTLIKALKKKLTPAGGFTVDNIPTDDESPVSLALVPIGKRAERTRSSNGFIVEDVSDSIVMSTEEVDDDDEDGDEECEDSDCDCNCSCHSESGEEGEEEEADEEGEEEEEEEVEECDEECDDSSCDCNCSCPTDEEHCDDSDLSVGSDAEEIEDDDDDDDDSMDWSDSYSSDSSDSSDESCPQLIPIGANVADDATSSSDDSFESDYESASEYEDVYVHSDDAPSDEDPMFFETQREPLIVTVGHGPTTQFAKFPLTVYEEHDASRALDTSIQNIVHSVSRSRQQQERKRAAKSGGAATSLNVSRVKFVDRLDIAEPIDAPKAPEIKTAAPVVAADVNDSPADNESPVDFDNTTSPEDYEDGGGVGVDDNNDAQYDPFEGVLNDLDVTANFGQTDDTKTVSTAANKPRFYNALNSRQVLLVLKAELHFHGILAVKLLAGNARIYGYDLPTGQTMRTFSPRGQSFLSMTPIGAITAGGDAAVRNAPTDLDTVQRLLLGMHDDFLNADIYEAIECFDPAAGDALLLLEAGDKQCGSFHMLDKYMRQAIYPNSNAFNAHRAFYSTEFILRTQFYTRPKTRLTINRQWVSLEAGSTATDRTMVIGGKGVGKSTYVRYLVNRAVQQHGGALLIDLDIGQPELFVPQCIAATCVRQPLLGAGYMLARAPDRALLFGEINVTIAPLKYLRCVLRLLRECAANADWQGVPWIVNTMGYNRGFGLEIVAAVLRVFAMTDVVQIQSQRRIDNYERVLSAELVNGFEFKFFRPEVEGGVGDVPQATHRTHVMRSMARKFGDKTADWDMSAKDTRMATVLAHLAPLLADGSEWLTDVRPVCAPLDSLQVIVANETVAAEQLLNLLDGNLVYLCRRTDGASDDHVECLGIGVVRGVDHIERNVYLLPAVDRARLALVNCLAVCNTPLPTSLIQNHSGRVQGRIPYAYNTDDFIGSKQVVRIAYRPDGTPRKN